MFQENDERNALKTFESSLSINRFENLFRTVFQNYSSPIEPVILLNGGEMSDNLIGRPRVRHLTFVGPFLWEIMKASI